MGHDKVMVRSWIGHGWVVTSTMFGCMAGLMVGSWLGHG